MDFEADKHYKCGKVTKDDGYGEWGPRNAVYCKSCGEENNFPIN